MKTLWTFGCSFTADYSPIDHPTIKSKYDYYKKWKGGVIPKVWPTLLGEKLGCKVENMGRGANSNYAIIKQFFKCVDKIKEGDIIIFGWTSIERFIVANYYINDFSHVLPSQLNYEGTGLSNRTIEEILINRTNPLWLGEVVDWIKFINLYTSKSKINIFHWTSDNRIFNKDSDFIDDKKFIVVKDEPKSTGMITYLSLPKFHNNKKIAKIIQETNGVIDDCHFGEYGHKVQSDFFYEHIKENI